MTDKTSGTAKTSTTRNPALRFLTIKYIAECLAVFAEDIHELINKGAA